MARSRLTTTEAGDRVPTPPPGDALALRLPALRAALEKQLGFRREQLTAMNADGHQPGNRVDPSDYRRPDAVSALREVDDLVAAGARRALADIELALIRIHTGRYGYCRSCDARIPLVVLEAVPKTTLCLGCQQRSTHGVCSPATSATWSG